MIDKFHVVQEINRCLDNVRKDIQNRIKKEQGNATNFYHSRKLFLTNWEDLSDKGFDRLNEWFTLYPDLYEAYMCKETFRDIYNNITDYNEAVRLFDMWLAAIPDFERFRAMKHTMTERKEHILNYWKQPVTNAFTESINNRIKAIEKAGRGYKFENLRKRCLLELNTPKPEKFDPSAATYYSSDGTAAPDRRRKIRRLYAPKADWKKPFGNTNHRIGFQTFYMTSYLSESVQPDTDISQYLELWLSVNENHSLSFNHRMTLYYQRIRTFT